MKNIKLKIQFIKHLINIGIYNFKNSWNTFKLNKITERISNNKFKSSETERINEALILNNQDSNIAAIENYNIIKENQNDFFHISTNQNKLRFLIKNEKVNS